MFVTEMFAVVMFVVAMFVMAVFVVVMMREPADKKVGGKAHKPAGLLQRSRHKMRSEEDDVF